MGFKTQDQDTAQFFTLIPFCMGAGLALSLHPIFFGLYIGGYFLWRRMQVRETRRRRAADDLHDVNKLLRSKAEKLAKLEAELRRMSGSDEIEEEVENKQVVDEEPEDEEFFVNGRAVTFKKGDGENKTLSLEDINMDCEGQPVDPSKLNRI